MEPLVVAAVGLLALAGGAVLGFLARGLFAEPSDEGGRGEGRR